jgi:hypothetical protein
LDKPAILAPSETTANERKYEAWEPLPSLRVALAPVSPVQPPQVSASLAIARGEARARHEVEFLNRNPGELAFQAPEGWLLSEAQVLVGGRPRGARASRPRGQPLARRLDRSPGVKRVGGVCSDALGRLGRAGANRPSWKRRLFCSRDRGPMSTIWPSRGPKS